MRARTRLPVLLGPDGWHRASPFSPPSASPASTAIPAAGCLVGSRANHEMARVGAAVTGGLVPFTGICAARTLCAATSSSKEEHLVRRSLRWLSVAIGAAIVSVIAARPATAQLNTQHIKGGVGLKAGSQPPPHTYVIAPLWYVYSADEVKDRDGNKGAGRREPDDSDFRRRGNGRHDEKDPGRLLRFPGAVPGGRQQPNPGDGDRRESRRRPHAIPSFSRSVSAGTANVRMPSSAIRFSCRTAATRTARRDNTGLGMWGNELSFGTTVYLNEARQYHVATIASFDFQSKKKDSETKVGNQ